jgi:chorismate mutase
MGMTEQKDRLAREREEIAARVANFKATQEKFQREREEYYAATLENARQSEHSRHTLERIPFWS